MNDPIVKLGQGDYERRLVPGGKPGEIVMERGPGRPPDIGRPRCRHCGADLAKHTRRIETQRIEDMPQIGDETQLGIVQMYTRRPFPVEGGGFAAFIWTGRYGHDGQNCFCNSVCAAAFANAKLGGTRNV